jgi:prophage DNA circulation protein
MSEEIKDAIARFIAVTDPLELNEVAALIGFEYVQIKNKAADKESHRIVLRDRIERRLRESGEAATDKAAERMARESEAYTEYCDDLSRLTLERDVAEVLYKTAYQRAWLLGNNPMREG